MEDINSIVERLGKGWDVKEARRAVADLIVEYIQSAQGSFGYWEKFHFANALSALGWNINSRHQPTTYWLRLCLVNLDKALVPAKQRNENYTPKDKEIESLTFEQLMDAAEAVRQNG